jgi:hypothetical protein
MAMTIYRSPRSNACEIRKKTKKKKKLLNVMERQGAEKGPAQVKQRLLLLLLLAAMKIFFRIKGQTSHKAQT